MKNCEMYVLFSLLPMIHLAGGGWFTQLEMGVQRSQSYIMKMEQERFFSTQRGQKEIHQKIFRNFSGIWKTPESLMCVMIVLKNFIKWFSTRNKMRKRGWLI